LRFTRKRQVARLIVGVPRVSRAHDPGVADEHVDTAEPLLADVGERHFLMVGFG